MINKLFFKKVVLGFLDKMGYLTYLHHKNREKICVLMLHGVIDPASQSCWEPLRPQLSTKELSRVLGILSNNYNFITVDQAVKMLDGKIPLIDNAMLITFDDGYRNNIDYALPICEKFSIKPVLFVTTGNLDSRLPFPVDRLDYALQQMMGEVISLQYNGNVFQFDATNRFSLQKSYKLFRDKIKGSVSDDTTINILFDDLSKLLEKKSGRSLLNLSNDKWTSIVSWDDLRIAVQDNRIDVASHTVDHWRLDCLSHSQINSQLSISKLKIEEQLSIKCNYFCYPNGNYNEQAVSLLKGNGYHAAFTTDVGLCILNDELMALKRFNFPSNKSEAELMYILNR
jgi:peptidoglycan/xylan/chitin deacetylase (PgdA/CDA1 family)